MKSPRIRLLSIVCVLGCLISAVASKPIVNANVATPGFAKSGSPSPEWQHHSRRGTSDQRAAIDPQAIPNILGVYTGSLSGASSNCTPGGGGASIGPETVTIEIFAQSGSSFNAFGFSTPPPGTTAGSSGIVPMNGTVTSDGTVTGTFDYESGGVKDAGTFVGSVVGGKMSLQLAGMTSVMVNGVLFGCDVMYTIGAGRTTPQAQSDLSIAVEVTPGPVAAGTRISYLYTVTNKGPSPATQAVMSDVILGGATLASVSTRQGTVSSPGPGGTGQITVLFGTIESGQSVAVTLTLNVLTPSGTTLSNTASVGSLSADPNPGDDSVTSNTPIVGGALVTLEWTQPTPTATEPTPAPTNVKAVPVIANRPTVNTSAAEESPASGSCTLVDINIYKSDQPNVQTIPANLWVTVPPSQAEATLATAPSGSFYVLTNLWNCGGSLIESGGSNQVSVPGGGPTLTKVKVAFKLKITGTGYTSVVTVFIDGIGFAKAAFLRDDGVLIQKGTMNNGMAIPDYVTSGKTILITVQNSDGGLGTLSYTQP